MRKAIFISIAGFFMLTLSGCGALPSLTNKSGDTKNAEEKTAQLDANNKGVSVNKPIVIPPRYNARPLKPGESESETLPNGLPAITIPKGLKLEALFSQKADDTEERFERIENALVEFRKEYDQIKPAVVRLAAIEEDMQDLISELGKFAEREQGFGNIEASAVVPEVPAAGTSQALEAPQALTQNDVKQAAKLPPPAMQKQPFAPVPASKAGASTYVRNIRIGNHADKIRIVLDIDGTADYELDLDNQEKLLILTLSGTQSAPSLVQERSFPNSALLSSYSVSQDNNTTRLVMSLRRDTMILSQEFLPPNGQNKHYRLFFDLKK